MPLPRISAAAASAAFARRWDLWWTFTVRAVEVRHRGSFLGMAWAVINPLLMLGLYATVFGYIFGSTFPVPGHNTTKDFVLGIFLGLIFFHVVAEVLAAAPSYILANPNLVKKVVFPLEVIPLANASAAWFHFLISLALFFGATFFATHTLSLTGLAWFPLILVPHILFTSGLAWMLSALGVFFRDLAQIVGFAAQVLMYASAIFYTPATLQSSPLPWLWQVLKWNPLLHTVDLARRSLLWDQPVTTGPLIYIWCAGIAMFATGLWFFRKTQSAFADVI